MLCITRIESAMNLVNLSKSKRARPRTQQDAEMKIGRIIPPALSTLTINENFQIHFTEPMPGRWHRFWYRLLLGWRWESVGKEGEKSL